MDRWITELVTEHRPDWVASAARAVTVLGSSWVAFGLLVAVLLSAPHVPPARRLVAGLGAWIACQLAVDGLKQLIDRPRPPASVALTHLTDPSMPSGHATRAALVGVVAWWVWRSRLSAAVAVTAVMLVAASRVVLGVHWFSDVVVGCAVGSVIACAACASLPRRRSRSAQ